MTIYSVFGLLAAAIVTPLCIAVVFIYSLVDSTGNRAHLVARVWAKILILVSSVKVNVSGNENIDKQGVYVFAANHSSVFDILVLLAFLPCQFRWMAKEELFRIPFFGQAMNKCGYIPINRSNPRESVRSVRRAAERIKSGTSVIIFPEGTRSKDGRIADFKRGGFTLAVMAGRPIVPISISGAARVMPPKSLSIRPTAIKVVLGSPIPTEGLDRHGQDRLMDQVRQVIIANYDPDYGKPAPNN